MWWRSIPPWVPFIEGWMINDFLTSFTILGSKDVVNVLLEIWWTARVPLGSFVFGLRIKDPLAPSVSPGFYSQIDRGGGVFQLGTRAEVLGSIPLSQTFSLR
jgi:hypothetical protein